MTKLKIKNEIANITDMEFCFNESLEQLNRSQVL